MASVPISLIVGVAFFADPSLDRLLDSRVLSLAFMFAVAGGVVFAITSFRPFLVAGEAERYIEPVLPFLNIVGLSYLSGYAFFGNAFLSLLMLSLIVISLNYFILNRKEFSTSVGSRSRISAGGMRLLGQLEKNAIKIGRPVRVVMAPTKLSFLFSANSNKGLVEFLFSVGYSESMKFEWMLEAFPDYLHLRDDLTFYREKYGIDLAIISRGLANLPRYQKIFSSFPIIFKDEEFFVVSTTPSSSNRVRD
jgi:hypothetical protein